MLARLRLVVVHVVSRRRLGRPPLGNVHDQCLLDRLSSRVIRVDHGADGLLRIQDPLVIRLAIGAFPRRNPDDQVGSVVGLPERIGILAEHLVPQVVHQIVFRDGHQGGGCARPFDPDLAVHHLGIRRVGGTVRLAPAVLRQQPVDQVLLRRWEEGLPPHEAGTFGRSSGGVLRKGGRTAGVAAGRGLGDGVEGGGQLGVGRGVYDALRCPAAPWLRRGDVALAGWRTQRGRGGGGRWEGWIGGGRPRHRGGGVCGGNGQQGLCSLRPQLWSTALALFALVCAWVAAVVSRSRGLLRSFFLLVRPVAGGTGGASVGLCSGRDEVFGRSGQASGQGGRDAVVTKPAVQTVIAGEERDGEGVGVGVDAGIRAVARLRHGGGRRSTQQLRLEQPRQALRHRGEQRGSVSGAWSRVRCSSHRGLASMRPHTVRGRERERRRVADELKGDDATPQQPRWLSCALIPRVLRGPARAPLSQDVLLWDLRSRAQGEGRDEGEG